MLRRLPLDSGHRISPWVDTIDGQGLSGSPETSSPGFLLCTDTRRTPGRRDFLRTMLGKAMLNEDVRLVMHRTRLVGRQGTPWRVWRHHAFVTDHLGDAVELSVNPSPTLQPGVRPGP